MLNSFDMKKATSIMKNVLKGKMSSSKINKTLNKNMKKDVRNYTLQLVDAFPSELNATTPYLSGSLTG